MKDIDFLPQRYRRDRPGQTAAVGRLATLLALVGVLACAWLLDVSKRSQLEHQLADATRQHEQMLTLANQCSALKSQWTRVNAQAELWTYLRHPWPKTQLLAALTATLPEALSLDELRIDRGEMAAMPQVGLLRDSLRVASDTDPAAANTQTAAQRDLAHLQAFCDARPVVVLLRGTTADMAELHAYLASIAQAPLFAKADLVSLERGPASQNVYRFVVRLTVRPGYGQPHGPAAPKIAGVAEAIRLHQASHPGANDGSQSR